MTKKKIIGLSVVGLLSLLLVCGVVVLVLLALRPEWYQYKERSEEDLLAAEERMISTAAKFSNESQVNEPFILELTEEQINEMLAVVIDRHKNTLPEHIANPVISLVDGAAFAGAMVTWKGRSSVVSVRIEPSIDSAGLLHIKLDRLKAGALGLPEDFLPDTLKKLEASLTSKLARSTSDSEQAKTARKNKDMLGRVFTALSGTAVEASFVTREDLQMAVEAIRISEGLLEITFRPTLMEESEEAEPSP